MQSFVSIDGIRMASPWYLHAMVSVEERRRWVSGVYEFSGGARGAPSGQRCGSTARSSAVQLWPALRAGDLHCARSGQGQLI